VGTGRRHVLAVRVWRAGHGTRDIWHGARGVVGTGTRRLSARAERHVPRIYPGYSGNYASPELCWRQRFALAVAASCSCSTVRKSRCKENASLTASDCKTYKFGERIEVSGVASVAKNRVAYENNKNKGGESKLPPRRVHCQVQVWRGHRPQGNDLRDAKCGPGTARRGCKPRGTFSNTVLYKRAGEHTCQTSAQ